MPKSPVNTLDLRRIDHGAVFEGSKGSIVAGFESRMILPGRQADMTYYKPRTKENLLPPVGDFQRPWFCPAALGSEPSPADYIPMI